MKATYINYLKEPTMDKPSTPEKSAAPTFAEQVITTAEQLIKGDDGKLALPEGVEASEEVLYAAKLEKRRRDTFSSYSKTKQENSTLKAENLALAEQWETDYMENAPLAKQAELAELKASDPDAYIEEIEKLKGEARTKFAERKGQVASKVREETELERRTRLVNEHNEANPDFQLNDDVIENDLPPRLTNQLKDGSITFDEFVAKAAAFLGKGKVIAKGEEAINVPDLGKSGGTSTPSDQAIDSDISESYKNTVF